MENTLANLSNNVQLESTGLIPSLTELGKMDSDVKDMVRLIAKYDLRERAVALISKKIKKLKKAQSLKPTFLG